MSGEFVILVGEFAGEVDFGTGPRVSDPGAIGEPQGDIFAAAYDRTTGAPRWSYATGRDRYDAANSAAVHEDGGIWITGTFEAELEAAGVVLDDAGRGDFFVMRLDPTTGAPTVAWSHGARSFDAGIDVAVTRDAVYLAGLFDDFASLGGETLNSSGDPIFVASYSLDGAHRWSLSLFAPSLSGSEFGAPQLVLDAAGGIYVAGSFTGDADLAGQIVTAAGTDEREPDVFVLRLDDSGERVWVRTFGNAYRDTPTDLLLVGDELVFRAAFEDTLTIAGTELVGPPRNPTLPSSDYYLAALRTDDGAETWAAEVGRDDPDALVLRADGTLIGRVETIGERPVARLVGIDATTRTISWGREVGASIQAIGTDGDGNLYVVFSTTRADLGLGPLNGTYVARFSAERGAP